MQLRNRRPYTDKSSKSASDQKASQLDEVYSKQEAQNADIAYLDDQLKEMMKLLEKSIGKKRVDEVRAN